MFFINYFYRFAFVYILYSEFIFLSATLLNNTEMDLKQQSNYSATTRVNNNITEITVKKFNLLVTTLTKNNTNNVTTLVSTINEAVNEMTSFELEYKKEKINNSKLIEDYVKELEGERRQFDQMVDKTLNKTLINYAKEKAGFYDPKVLNSSMFAESDSEDRAEYNNDIWEPSYRRIFGGRRTKIKHYPFMASVHVMGRFSCAGSIIDTDLVITAASCLQLAWNNRFFRENPRFVSVRVGSTFYYGGGEVIPVFQIYFHPSYDPKTLKHNLAIMRLIRHIKFNKKNRKKVMMIKIDKHANALPYNTDGVLILGWGSTKRSGKAQSPWLDRLTFAVLDFYDTKSCQEVYTSNYVTSKNFCAGFISHGGGACNRDVGDPGIVDDKLTGIASFGAPVCGTEDAPTVFVKLGFYTDWIEEIIEMDVPHRMRSTTLPTPQTWETHTYPTTRKKLQPITRGKEVKRSKFDDANKEVMTTASKTIITPKRETNDASATRNTADHTELRTITRITEDRSITTFNDKSTSTTNTADYTVTRNIDQPMITRNTFTGNSNKRTSTGNTADRTDTRNKSWPTVPKEPNSDNFIIALKPTITRKTTKDAAKTISSETKTSIKSTYENARQPKWSSEGAKPKSSSEIFDLYSSSETDESLASWEKKTKTTTSKTANNKRKTESDKTTRKPLKTTRPDTTSTRVTKRGSITKAMKDSTVGIIDSYEYEDDSSYDNKNKYMDKKDLRQGPINNFGKEINKVKHTTHQIQDHNVELGDKSYLLRGFNKVLSYSESDSSYYEGLSIEPFEQYYIDDTVKSVEKPFRGLWQDLDMTNESYYYYSDR